MQLYFSKVTQDHWVAKNRLEAEAKTIALYAERRLIPEEKLEAFKTEFQKRISRANLQSHRCKPLELDIRTFGIDNGDITIYIPGVFQMSLYKVHVK